MKWLKSIEDFTQHIFTNKERAAKRHLNTDDAEKPREVYERVCQLIAEELSAIGFKYFPSQHKLKLESTDKKHNLTIQFSSNRDNVAGQYIELSVAFFVKSKDLKSYAKSNPLLDYWDDTMIGRNIAALVKEGKGNLIWNLAEKKEYENAIALIPKIAREELSYIFEKLQDSEWVADAIEEDSFELNNPIVTVQYLLMVDQKHIAEKYLSAFLIRKPDQILVGYKKAKEKFKSEGMPETFTHGLGFGHEIALLENEYQLKLTVRDPASGTQSI
ncbi:MAG: hypothetical protein Roseis2KO_17210 [Roseivirga sp.]